VHGLSKRFGDRVAFQDVSFEIGYGEVFGFLGPNGAGKTTTMRTLGTLIAPTSGSATVAGIPLTLENGAEIRRRIAIMPESPGLYLRLSVTENLACFADLYEVPDAGDRIDRALRAAGLADRASDTCSSLSKGLRQRVAPGQGAAQRPRSPVPRRADRRTGPGRRPRCPQPDRRPPPARRHDLPHYAPPGGGRAALRPSRDPEHDPAHDRPARRASRSAVLQDTRGQDPRPAFHPAGVFGALPAVDGWHPDGPAGYVLAVSDPAVAAPAAIRALVAAGADVLSISESRHSLEDVYLELIDQDEEASRR
jgi:ABC-2 type transport system ATP-binding protein